MVIWSQKRKYYRNHSLKPVKWLFGPKKGQYYKNHTLNSLKRLFFSKRATLHKSFSETTKTVIWSQKRQRYKMFL